MGFWAVGAVAVVWEDGGSSRPPFFDFIAEDRFEMARQEDTRRWMEGWLADWMEMDGPRRAFFFICEEKMVYNMWRRR